MSRHWQRAIYHYATKSDYEDVVLPIEKSHSLKYVLVDYYDEPHPQTYKSALELPNFGAVTSGIEASNPNYLVVSAEQNVQSRRIELYKGGVRYSLDQLENPNSITFQPSGTYWKPEAITRQPKGKIGDDCLIQGDFATISDSDFALKLFRAFAYRVRKTFTRVDSYWIGPEALRLWGSGVHLTPEAQTRLADLQSPSPSNIGPPRLLDAKQPE